MTPCLTPKNVHPPRYISRGTSTSADWYCISDAWHAALSLQVWPTQDQTGSSARSLTHACMLQAQFRMEQVQLQHPSQLLAQPQRGHLP